MVLPVTVEVEQHHLFRYPSEWDPRKDKGTKEEMTEEDVSES